MKALFGNTMLKALGLGLLSLVGLHNADAARPWPDSSDRIIVFVDQLPGSLTAAQQQFAATHLAGTQKMLRSDIRALRTYNTNFLCLHYQLALGCGAHDFIVGDAWTSDWAYVNSQESWFLHNASVQRVHQTAWDWDVMDITFTGGTPNTGFPQYWVTTCLERLTANEDDAVFADSFTIDGLFDQCNPSHPWLSNVDDCLANWIPNLNIYGTAIKNVLDADGRGFLFLPNLGGLVTGWDTTDYGVGHGGMIEGFCFWQQNDYFNPADWQLQMERALSLVRSNKIVICQSYINSADNTSDRLFALGAYLLIKGRYTYINLMATGELEYYPEYALDLGPAIGSVPEALTNLWYAPWQVYRRDCANGLVLVNPDATAVTIPNLGANYWLVSAVGGGPINEAGESSGSLAVSSVTSLTMPAHSGAILLYAYSAVPVAADFDSDRRADPTLVTNGNWWVWFSGNGYQHAGPFAFQAANGTPLAADFDDDGRADPAMVLSNIWTVWLSGNGYQPAVFDFPSPATNGQPLTADFDGDHRADPTIYQPATGDWSVYFSSQSYQRQDYINLLGGLEWTAQATDFDGDRLADPAIVQTTTGDWSVLFSCNGYGRADFPGLIWGSGSQAAVADFDGDGWGDPAIYTSVFSRFTALFSSADYTPVTTTLSMESITP